MGVFYDTAEWIMEHYREHPVMAIFTIVMFALAILLVLLWTAKYNIFLLISKSWMRIVLGKARRQLKRNKRTRVSSREVEEKAPTKLLLECPVCKSVIPAGERFCPGCGTEPSFDPYLEVSIDFVNEAGGR